MIFEKIANGITKHYKAVVVVWIVALLISVPAIMKVSDVVSYETSFGSADMYESTKANDIISKEFPTSVANGTLIVLLQADNVTDAQVRDFVIELQKRIHNSSELKYLEGSTTVYSYGTTVIEQVVLQLGPNMRPAEENITLGADFIWGIPAAHAGIWSMTHDDNATYNATADIINETMANLDPQMKALAFTYYNAFANVWNHTSSIADPYARATNAVTAVAPGFIHGLPAPLEQLKTILLADLATFNITSVQDEDYVNATSHQMMLGMISQMASISNMTFLQQVYDLPAYNASVVNPFASEIIANGTLATYPYPLPAQLVTNFVSANNQSMLMMVTFSVDAAYVEKNGDKPLLDDVVTLRNIISSLKSSTDGVEIVTYVTGDAAISADMAESSTHDMEMIEPITIIVIIVLMGYLFRSVVGQFLPLGAVGVAIGISQALVFVIGSTIAQINYTVTTMLFAILMGVGTDYSIFIITRYREERIKGATKADAVKTAVAWAGESIVTSGATVIIAFFAMALSSFAFVQTMGLLLGLAIVVALLVALTLVPAILMFTGNRIFWPNTGKRFEKFAQNVMQKKREGNHGYFHRAASFSVKHAKVVILAAILVSIPTTYIFFTEETSFDFIGTMGHSESIDGMDEMTEDFGAGLIMPTYVVVTGNTVVYQNGAFNYEYLDALDNITATVAGDDKVQQVTSVTRPFGQWIDYRNLDHLTEEEKATITAAMLRFVGQDNTSVMMTVVLKEQPQESHIVSYMPTMRDKLHAEQATQPALANATIMLGGATAALYDMGQDTTSQFTNIEVIVMVGIFIVLMVVLGSLLLPAFAVASIAMSITWAFTATTLVFGDWLGLPVLWIIPLILFVMLMGIGMDYNVFILTRIREEAHKGKDIKTAVVDAVDWTGGIITALALIMAGAFGSLMLSSNAMLQEFGFALLLAVLLDAMVVRTYIVPAAIVLMGKWAWWAPGRLQRVGREEKTKKKDGEQSA